MAYYQAIQDSDNSSQLKASIVREGEWACEIALWATAVVNTGFFQASRCCEIITINTPKFRSVAQANPTSRDILRRYARIFVERFNEAGVRGTCQNVLFNTFGIIEELVAEATEMEVHTPRRTSLRKNLSMSSSLTGSVRR